MKIRRFVHLLSLAALCSGQIADNRPAESKARHDRGEKVTLEEQDLWSTSVERQNQENSAKRNADYARQHPARESTGLVPLPDLGKALYQGEQGGLYPGGASVAPTAHQQAGLRLAREITPLDRDGHPAPGGLILLL